MPAHSSRSANPPSFIYCIVVPPVHPMHTKTTHNLITFFQIVYEGVSQGAVSFLVRALTEKKTRYTPSPLPPPACCHVRGRTGPAVRAVFSKLGGSLSGANSISWKFKSVAPCCTALQQW